MKAWYSLEGIIAYLKKGRAGKQLVDAAVDMDGFEDLKKADQAKAIRPHSAAPPPRTPQPRLALLLSQRERTRARGRGWAKSQEERVVETARHGTDRRMAAAGE